MNRSLKGAVAGAVAFCGLAWSAAPTEAVAQEKGAIVVERAWARATPPGATAGGAYLTVVNNGTAADRLVGAAFPGAKRVEVHEMAMEGDIMRMRPVEGGLEIGAGETRVLEPGGLHLMLMGLEAPLAAGDSVEATLTFSKAGDIPASVTVVPIGGSEPGS